MAPLCGGSLLLLIHHPHPLTTTALTPSLLLPPLLLALLPVATHRAKLRSDGAGAGTPVPGVEPRPPQQSNDKRVVHRSSFTNEVKGAFMTSVPGVVV
jgi:hypothetical protein